MRGPRKSAAGAFVIALLLVLMVGAAEAKKPDRTGPPSQEVAAGTTCEAAGQPTGIGPPEWDDDDQGFTISLNGDADYACVDVVWDTPGRWNLTITGSGARSVTVVPRDSVAPGDSCGGAQLRGESVYGTFFLPLDIDTRIEIPAGSINACGTQFGEWVNDGAICAEIGKGTEVPCLIADTHPEHAHPLAFQASVGGRHANVTIHVRLP